MRAGVAQEIREVRAGAAQEIREVRAGEAGVIDDAVDKVGEVVRDKAAEGFEETVVESAAVLEKTESLQHSPERAELLIILLKKLEK